MVSVNELLDQSGAKIEQIISTVNPEIYELGPEHLATRLREILETFQEMKESLQPVLHHFNGLDLERIHKLGICSQELLNSLGSEQERGVSSRNRLETDNYEYQGVLLPSQVKHMETIWEWLNNDRVGTIGIEGEVGMGKTWMVRQLKDRAIAANLFDVVIWMDPIWMDPNQKSFLEAQQELVDQLGFFITKEPDEEYYGRKEIMLKVALALGKKRYLLILNNLRHEDTIVEDFGFSKPGEQNVYSKVLVSGPKMYIDLIKTDRKFQVEPLNDDEAWLLFLGITGLDIDSPHAVEIAKPLVASCNGVLSEIVSRDDGRDVAEITNKVCHLLNSDKMEVIECLRFCSYLSQVGRIKVTDFIAWLILEVFDDCLGLEEAYEKAHHVLQELIDGRFLERNETHVWVKNKLVFHLELDHFFTSDTLPPEYKNKRSCVMNEKFKSKDSGNAKEREETTELLLIYGKHMKGYNFLRYIPDDIFKKMQKLHTLAILNAGIVFLPESLPNLKHLEMLIISGCGSLKNLDPIRGLWNLKLLFLPGASSLKKIPDDIFKNMDKLEELDLSNSQLEQLPSSFSNLRNIQILILRGCSRLTSIPDMPYQKLIELDLSGTLVQSLPSPSNLANIEDLFLRGCTEITTMPHPNKYKNLDVIDLSGATSFREFQGKNIAFGYKHFLSKVDLSGTLIAQVPPFVEFYNVSKFLLRNCCHLETMPALYFSLEVLDLSGSIAFKNFHDTPLSDQLRNLDLSKTQIEKLPVLSMNSAMVQLILRECRLLEELPHLELQKLQVLDLSGSTKFKTFKDDSFDKLRKLKTLNLSETQVANLPTLSQCSELQHLILRKCLKLEELPHLVTLEKLELLDLSSAISFKQFKEESLGKKEELHELNLFETQVVQIPSLSECHNLCKLILGGCSKLEILPNLEALSRLVVLDLSGISLIKFHYQSTGLKYDCLQVLDLSGTQVSDVSFISRCKDLRQLSLRDCPNILTLPPLDELTRLEELDLSRTETTELSFLSGCRSIIQLLLNDCSNILELTSLKEHTRLEVLDIAGTKIYDLSVLTGFNKLSQLSLRGCPNLKTLSFEGMQNLLKLNLSHSSIKLLPSSFSGIRNLQSLLLTDCSSLGTLPHMEFLPNLEVLDLSCTNVREFPNDISALTHLRFLKLQEENNQWELHKGKSFENFHFCLFAPKERIGENDIYLQGQQYSFKDIYYQTSHIPSLAEEPDKFFKICGFQTFPAGIEEVLLHVVLLYLKKNNFLTRLSDLGAGNVREMRECWIENCDSMEFVFYGEEVNENGALGRCLENLWVSKLPELKSLFRGVVQPGSFTLLKHLYIECCPSLITVFSSHLELKNLEVLKMKFCDKIEGIFGETVIGEKTLPKLKTLILLKLPELQSICGGVLPSLQNLRVIGCSKIKRLPVSRKATSPVKIKGEAVWWNDLEWEDEGTKSHQRFSPY